VIERIEEIQANLQIPKITPRPDSLLEGSSDRKKPRETQVHLREPGPPPGISGDSQWAIIHCAIAVVIKARRNVERRAGREGQDCARSHVPGKIKFPGEIEALPSIQI